MRKALTVLELLVTIVLSLTVLAAVYSAYLALFKNYEGQSTSLATFLESSIGLEVFRQDLEHAGYGISENVTKPAVEIETGTSSCVVSITIRSTYKVSSVKTHGMAILDCSNSSSPVYTYYPSSQNQKEIKAVVMQTDGMLIQLHSPSRKFFILPGQYSEICNKEKGKILLAFPVEVSDSWLNSTEMNNSTQAYSVIRYCLSNDTNDATDYCKGTYVLKRGVDEEGEKAFLECVGDLKILYDWDGTLCDPTNSSSSCHSPTKEDLEKNLNMIYVYFLLREGKKDRSFTFKNSVRIDEDKDGKTDVILKLPSFDPDAVHYRWRVVRLAIKPMNLKR